MRGAKATLFVLSAAILRLSEAAHGGNEALNLDIDNQFDQEDEPTLATEEEVTERSNKRTGKLFSLFNIVNFQNGGCQTQSSVSSPLSAANRNGTCYTSSQCSSAGGTASGTCASGFGVCCLFVVSSSTSAFSQNCTYVRNPGYPSAYTSSSSVSYTVKKSSNSVCWLRLDFEAFTILGTGLTTEVNGGVCQDTFIASVGTAQTVPTICGQNFGQHNAVISLSLLGKQGVKSKDNSSKGVLISTVYLDVGNLATDTATLAFTFNSSAATRNWEIKVTQLPCYGAGSSADVPPPGCLQYNTGLTGRLTTFNFIPTNDNHLANQFYSICMRQEAGYCCIQYTICSDPNSFSLDAFNTPAIGTALVDSSCFVTKSKDFITIAASAGTCIQGNSQVPVISKYCGIFFNSLSSQKASTAVCDCTEPFVVEIHTNSFSDKATAVGPNTQPSRGLCLNYMQIPCAT